MKGAIFVIKRNGEIISMNRDAERIIVKDRESNQDLHLETSVNWLVFDIKNLIEQVKRMVGVLRMWKQLLKIKTVT